MAIIKILAATTLSTVAQVIKPLLESQADFHRVGRVENVEELIKISQDTQPDILLLCQVFGDSRTIELVREYSHLFKSTKIILVATNIEQLEIRKLFNAGVKGYFDIFKCTIEEVCDAIRLVSQGQLFPRSLNAELTVVVNRQNQSAFQSQPEDLGEREIQVLKLIAYGNSSKLIAKQLNIAASTVDVHRRNIMRKLNVRKSADLIRYAIKYKIIEL